MDAVIRVYGAAGNVIETHEHAGISKSGNARASRIVPEMILLPKCRILRQLIRAPAGQDVSIARLKIDPVWDPIRNDPGFQKLLSEPEPATIYK